jgi:hypothetical protein
MVSCTGKRIVLTDSASTHTDDSRVKIHSKIISKLQWLSFPLPLPHNNLVLTPLFIITNLPITLQCANLLDPITAFARDFPSWGTQTLSHHFLTFFNTSGSAVTWLDLCLILGLSVIREKSTVDGEHFGFIWHSHRTMTVSDQVLCIASSAGGQCAVKGIADVWEVGDALCCSPCSRMLSHLLNCCTMLLLGLRRLK